MSEIIDIKELLSFESEPFLEYEKKVADYIEYLKSELDKNKSVDEMAIGFRGDGKSTWALATAYALNKFFNVSHIVFDFDSFVQLASTLPRGSVIVYDESGTEESGFSSRRSMSKENRGTSDIWQKIRTRGIIVIMIAPDKDRIDKRVRDTFRFKVTPIKMYSDEETGGQGLAIGARVLETVKHYPESELFTTKEIPALGASEIILTLPPAALIQEYEKRREASLKYSLEVAKK